MLINSKLLFQQLLTNLTMDADPSEKKAVLFYVLRHQFNLSRLDLMKDKEVDYAPSTLDEIIKRLNRNEPLQYVLGEADFYGRKFFVDSSVLIPRPETELLIREVKNRLVEKGKRYSILDVGTGSGCIAITLALEFLFATITATDVSPGALKVAQRNASQLNAKVDFQKHDILNSELGFGQFDLIVSNPPYIAEFEKSSMQKNIIEYEPHLALFVPDSDALIFYRALCRQSRKYLRREGWLIVEINERFGSETKSLLEVFGFDNIKIIKDIDGKDRFVVGKV